MAATGKQEGGRSGQSTDAQTVSLLQELSTQQKGIIQPKGEMAQPGCPRGGGAVPVSKAPLVPLSR